MALGFLVSELCCYKKVYSFTWTHVSLLKKKKNLLVHFMSLDGNSENLVAEYKFLEGKMSFTLDK